MAKSKDAKIEHFEVDLIVEKQCGASVRYKCAAVGAHLTNFYLSRTFTEQMPDKIKAKVSPGLVGEDGEENTVHLTVDKQCGPSVRYANKSPSSVLANIYINRTAWSTMPDSITVVLS